MQIYSNCLAFSQTSQNPRVFARVSSRMRPRASVCQCQCHAAAAAPAADASDAALDLPLKLPLSLTFLRGGETSLTYARSSDVCRVKHSRHSIQHKSSFSNDAECGIVSDFACASTSACSDTRCAIDCESHKLDQHHSEATHFAVFTTA